MQNIHKKHIYIIGIGGKGLNAIAEFCLLKGYLVSGSDIKESPETMALADKGAAISYTQDGSSLSSDVELVVHSSVIKKGHPEIVRAQELGIPVVSRAEFLGDLTKGFERISVAGSHGKSTTSALATLALHSVYGSVNSITGAYMKEFGSYQSVGKTKECVIEACEYGKSFLRIPGDYTIITELEKSHMESFLTENFMNEAFSEFVSCHKGSSTLIINGDNRTLRTIVSGHAGKVVTCGFKKGNTYSIKDVSLESGRSVFSIYLEGRCIESNIQIHIPGRYNILNVALVLALMHEKNLDTSSFRQTLRDFKGVGRRFELSQRDTTVFVDDFAHHPTQVENLIEGIRQFFPAKKIYAVFEPRQYHLIRTFLKEYGKSLRLADEVCVTDIVPALGDTAYDIESLSTGDVLKSIRRYSKTGRVWYAPSYQEIAQRLGAMDLANAVVATVGAGSVYKVRDLLANRVQ